jgi:hypothetical protein
VYYEYLIIFMIIGVIYFYIMQFSQEEFLWLFDSSNLQFIFLSYYESYGNIRGISSSDKFLTRVQYTNYSGFRKYTIKGLKLRLV